MEGQYQITVNMRRVDGITEIGRFFAGDDEELAMAIFEQLQGSRQSGGHPLLRLDLVERTESIDLKLAHINCTLAEYQLNCGIIARELFKLHNLI